MSRQFGGSPAESVVEAFLNAIYRLDGDAVLSALADDAEWWLLGSLPVSGCFRGKASIASDFLTRFGPLYQPGSTSFELRNVVAAADEVVVEWLGRGVTSAGDHYENPYCYVFRVLDGEIVTIRGYTDTAYAAGMLFGQLRSHPTL